MTANAINYLKAQEDRRKNRKSEELTTYSNETGRMQAETQRMSAEELARHQRASEQIELGKLNETAQHNRATESVERGKLAETKRHQLESEDISRTYNQGQLEESRRHNQTTERETNRHNEASEGLESTKITQNYVIEQSKLREQQRSNMANEAINQQRATTDAKRQAMEEKFGEYGSFSDRTKFFTDYTNSRTNQTNASINQQNADTRSREVDVKEAQGNRDLDIKQQQADTAQYVAETGRKDLTRKWVDTVTGGIKDITQAGKNVNDIAATWIITPEVAVKSMGAIGEIIPG